MIQTGLSRGERARDFVLPVGDGTPTRFYALAGGCPTVLGFCSDGELETMTRFSENLSEQLADAVAVFAVTDEAAQDAADSAPFPVFADAEGKVRLAFRLQKEEAVLFVLDANLRVLNSLYLDEPENAAKTVADIVAALPGFEPIKVKIQAPVLLLPNILEPETCQHLIEVWEKGGSTETGVERSQEGRRQESIDHEHKRRRDHVVMDRELLKQLTLTIGSRLMPEVQKAFVFQASRFEGFKIVCYDAETGGYFHAHRDNLSPSTAHRRFALTLNLNDDYDGGYLRFPEYGPHLYRPGPGETLVFSSSILHEVTDVTRGRRFALLSFLFSEKDVRASQRKQG